MPRRAPAGEPFRPVAWLPGGDLQTIVPHLWRRPTPRPGVAELWIDVDPGSQVLLEIDHPREEPRGTLLLLHGMGGSARSSYMVITSRSAADRGWVAVRMNLRNCGGTAHRARTLYNAGQSADVDRVLAALERRPGEFPRPFVATGFSLGANIVMRYAGLEEDGCRADAVAGVSTPIDLECCMQALESPRNRIYHWYYTVKVCRHLREIKDTRGLDGPDPQPRRIGSMRRLDDLFTAPDAGYASAEAYYDDASAGPRLSGIRRPAMLLSAVNDPFVPPQIFTPHRGIANIRLVQPPSGGHVGYWHRGQPRCWAATALVEFAEGTLRRPPVSPVATPRPAAPR